MTGVVSINARTNTPNIRITSFKAGENDNRMQQMPRKTYNNPSVITAPPVNNQIALQRMMQAQQNKEKKQKLKQNLSWGIGIASGVAIIAMVLAQFKAMKGSAANDAKAEELKAIVKKILNPGIKREAEEELARQNYERSLYRVQDLIKLDELAQMVEKREPADLEKVKKIIQ